MNLVFEILVPEYWVVESWLVQEFLFESLEVQGLGISWLRVWEYVCEFDSIVLLSCRTLLLEE